MNALVFQSNPLYSRDFLAISRAMDIGTEVNIAFDFLFRQIDIRFVKLVL